MANNQDYLVNHSRALKFPWSIYHKPLIRSLEAFISELGESSQKNILVIGPGDFQEIETLFKGSFNVSVLDIDERVLINLKSKYSDRIKNYYLVDEYFNGYPPCESFHYVYAKEVVEHFTSPVLFIKEINRILKDGGKFWLSTPNYGFFLLPLIERTILEVIAKFSGFSRKNIHPTKYDINLLEEHLLLGAFEIKKLSLTPFHLAIIAVASKLKKMSV